MNIYNTKGTKKYTIPQLIIRGLLALVFAPFTLLLLGQIRRLRRYCKAKTYTVTQLPQEYKDRTNLIAHRGFRAVAPENTLPAFEAAGEAGFWGAENDIHRTKDGVWVVHHDCYTFRMMNKSRHIENTKFITLQSFCYDNGSNIRDYPCLGIATLEEYLQVCARYGMKAFIELKGKRNTQYYGEIVDMVSKYGVDATYISFEQIAITTMRRLTDAPLFYIVYKITQEAVDFARSVENCGIDFDGDDRDNQSRQMVDMIHNAGLDTAIWAVDDVELVKKYVDWGVKNITTNQIIY